MSPLEAALNAEKGTVKSKRLSTLQILKSLQGTRVAEAVQHDLPQVRIPSSKIANQIPGQEVYEDELGNTPRSPQWQFRCSYSAQEPRLEEKAEERLGPGMHKVKEIDRYTTQYLWVPNGFTKLQGLDDDIKRIASEGITYFIDSSINTNLRRITPVQYLQFNSFPEETHLQDALKTFVFLGRKCGKYIGLDTKNHGNLATLMIYLDSLQARTDGLLGIELGTALILGTIPPIELIGKGPDSALNVKSIEGKDVMFLNTNYVKMNSQGIYITPPTRSKV